MNTINEKFYVDFANWLSHLELFTEYIEIVIGLKAKMSNVTIHDIVLDDLQLVHFEDSDVKGISIDIQITQTNISIEYLDIRTK